jgi:hypothetical protein
VPARRIPSQRPRRVASVSGRFNCISTARGPIGGAPACAQTLSTFGIPAVWYAFATATRNCTGRRARGWTRTRMACADSVDAVAADVSIRHNLPGVLDPAADPLTVARYPQLECLCNPSTSCRTHPRFAPCLALPCLALLRRRGGTLRHTQVVTLPNANKRASHRIASHRIASHRIGHNMFGFLRIPIVCQSVMHGKFPDSIRSPTRSIQSRCGGWAVGTQGFRRRGRT